MGKGPSIKQGTFDEFGGLAKTFSGLAQNWAASAEKPVQQAQDFYSALLAGGQGAQNVVAPSAMAINKVYGGAQKSVKNFMPRGGERNLAEAELGNERAGKIADLYANVQPWAAGQLSALGFGRASAGSAFGGGANQGYGSLVDYQGQRNQAVGAAWGGIGQGLGSLAGGAITKYCWIAEVLYGVTDERTFRIRRWLNSGALPWQWRAFRFVYGTAGRQIAAILKACPVLQPMLRPLFGRALIRATQQAVVCGD